MTISRWWCAAALAALTATAPAQTATAPAADDDESDMVVTASRTEAAQVDLPYAVDVVSEDTLRTGPDSRSLPNALSREPSVLLQKTGPGQSSPYIRGFTGFRTLFLVDGVRLNNSVWRDGPNQYVGTVDQYSISSVELVKGPGAVLWGSEAIGGVIGARTAPSKTTDGFGGRFATRYSTGECSWFQRLELEGGVADEWSARLGITNKDFGAINAGRGSGDLHGTSYDEEDLDFRFDAPVDDNVDFTFVYQRARQFDVPRTERTIDSVPWHGTVTGSELRRDLDQSRDLAYARLAFRPERETYYDNGEITLSWQRHREEQNRLRTGGRRDVTGFDVETLGLAGQMSKDTSSGLWTWGFDYYEDDVSSSRRDYLDGVFTGEQIQGPVGDDSEASLLGVFVQNQMPHDDGEGETTFGLRWTRASVDSDRVDNPNVAGSSPMTPGNVIGVDQTWSNLSASVRALRYVDNETSVYAGVSQGFRAPNLSDLTSELEDSGIESPSPDLDPEHYLTFEVGAKAEHAVWDAEVALHYTFVDDMIIRSPTGETTGDGTPFLQKSNAGDGSVYGVEASGEWRFAEGWAAHGLASWLDTQVDQFRADGSETSGPMSRTQPFIGVLGVTRRPHDVNWWWQADVVFTNRADKLSLRDETDLRRIPPGGTPGYTVFGVRGGVDLDERSTLTVGLENIFDKDYRVHGSGQNEPGRSLVVSYAIEF